MTRPRSLFPAPVVVAWLAACGSTFPRDAPPSAARGRSAETPAPTSRSEPPSAPTSRAGLPPKGATEPEVVDAPAEEDNSCPTESGPPTALRRGTSHGTPPSKATTQRLSPKQRNELAFLAPLCETAVLVTDGRVQVGCACCPPFEECPPVRGGPPRGDVDQAYGSLTHSVGSFTRAGARELAVSFEGCEPHSSNWGGTMLYREVDGAWAFVSYLSGMRPDRCQKYRLVDRRDILICEWLDVHMSARLSLLKVDFAAPDHECWGELTEYPSNAGSCEGGPLIESTVDRVRLTDLNRDGILDVRVDFRQRQGAPSPAYTEACYRTHREDRVLTTAELDLLGPEKRSVDDFVSDGRGGFRRVEPPGH